MALRNTNLSLGFRLCTSSFNVLMHLSKTSFSASSQFWFPPSAPYFSATSFRAFVLVLTFLLIAGWEEAFRFWLVLGFMGFFLFDLIQYLTLILVKKCRDHFFHTYTAIEPDRCGMQFLLID